MENAVPTDLVAHSHGASSVPGSDFIAGIFGGAFYKI
jgi:hypothetical protein